MVAAKVYNVRSCSVLSAGCIREFSSGGRECVSIHFRTYLIMADNTPIGSSNPAFAYERVDTKRKDTIVSRCTQIYGTLCFGSLVCSWTDTPPRVENLEASGATRTNFDPDYSRLLGPDCRSRVPSVEKSEERWDYIRAEN